MLIANPIYDAVFKYLLEDTKVAKLFLSAILKLEVIDLESGPQEHTTVLGISQVTVYRVDFNAKVQLKGGAVKQVLIELQKAKLPSDLLRFRRYLGSQYADKRNGGRPLLSIYFLGYPLETAGLDEIPIIRICRLYLDSYTEQIIDASDEFIEGLTHDSVIIQIPAVKAKRRDQLERLLSVFEPGTQHEIAVEEEEHPEHLRPILRRLACAASEQEIRDTMDLEDDYLADLQEMQRRAEAAQANAEAAQKSIEEERVQRKAAEEQARAEREEREAAQEQAKAERKEREAAEEHAKTADQKLIATAKRLAARGLSHEEIAEVTSLDVNEIRQILAGE